MNLYPKSYFENILEIKLNFLNDNNIKGLILDVDNTLIDYYKNLLNGAEDWCQKLKNEGIRFCIVSNSNKKQKVEDVATKLRNTIYLYGKETVKIWVTKRKKYFKFRK